MLPSSTYHTGEIQRQYRGKAANVKPKGTRDHRTAVEVVDHAIHVVLAQGTSYVMSHGQL